MLFQESNSAVGWDNSASTTPTDESDLIGYEIPEEVEGFKSSLLLWSFPLSFHDDPGRPG